MNTDRGFDQRERQREVRRVSSSKRIRPHLDFESSRIVFWSNYRYANVRSVYLCALIMVHATSEEEHLQVSSSSLSSKLSE